MQFKKTILFLLLLWPMVSSAQGSDPQLLIYTQLVSKQALTGATPIFNPGFKKISADSLYHKYIGIQPNTADEWSDNFYKPNTLKEGAFIKTFRFGFFEGLLGMPDIVSQLYDTSTNKINSHYIDFNLYQYNDNGTPKKNKKLFSVRRDIPKIDRTAIAKKALAISSDSINRKKTKLLITNDTASWQIAEIWVNNKKSPVDTCQLNYRLELRANMQFAQYYADTSLFNINRKAALDTGIDRTFYFFKDRQHVQCYLENSRGIWAIQNNKLSLITFTGITLVSYKIVKLTKDEMQLQAYNYKVRFIKKHI